MSNSLDKLKALTSRLEEELSQKEAAADVSTEEKREPKVSPVPTPAKKNEKPVENISFEGVREENIARVKALYEKLKIFEKSPNFDDIFIYKAMNLSGIGLKEEDFGEVREGKYIQIIAITYEPDKNGKKKAKNVSLGYFGKAETLDPTLKNEIIEFVLRWRYEKAFQNVEHYKDLIARVETPKETLF
ncbi:hypothetical protein [Sulfurovum sp. NBC37-1]|uniref:hypothetical protein n=1 Tax=Sulfurovum sp. (strain NBC37-1) TaxID=387093 RepID=UPI0001587581|nr:hypothetical protein [Sulfurovum sp. NBC37-1]BAF72144.1 conserved hypothetical protein [Sulfurovum sp. NBC37-1]